jgi:dihydrodipicolinate synthase/N-acetylneuraminate lyase
MQLTRREILGGFGSLVLTRPSAAALGKSLRGVFVIMATPYTTAKDVDFEDLAREVDFLDRCGVHGMVWPQLASEYSLLRKEERMRGMETIARAARGKKPALVLGVQGPDKAAAIEYAERAESLAPDALIAMPPSEGKSLDEYRDYYRALARVSKRPIFIQTTGGAKGLTPPVDMLVELAREFPNYGYVKEEAQPVIERMTALAKQRPAVKAVFSGAAGRGMLYEARLGFDGTMPGATYGDIHAQVFDLWHSGQKEKARDLFAKLLLLLETEHQIPGVRPYVLQRRGVAKTAVSRRSDAAPGKEAIREIEFNLEILKPHLRVPIA